MSAIVDVDAAPGRDGCGAPATRSQTTLGCDALRSRPSGLKVSGELDPSPVICASGEPAPNISRTVPLIELIRSGPAWAIASLAADGSLPGAAIALVRSRVRRFSTRSPVAVSNRATPSP